MHHCWQPSPLALRLQRFSRWSLHWDGKQFTLQSTQAHHRISLTQIERLQVIRKWPWCSVVLLDDAGDRLHFPGLSRQQTTHLQQLLSHLKGRSTPLDRQHQRQQILSVMQQWIADADALNDRAISRRHWISHEQQQQLLLRRSEVDHVLQSTLFSSSALAADGDAKLSGAFEQCLLDWHADWPLHWQQANAALTACARDNPVASRVESRPLTDEQAQAVVCFDNRVLLIAAAGSGKTSTLIAKAAYAIEHGIAAPRDIILLAFNKEAATELSQRAEQAFQRLGKPQWNVDAQTFHALGLQIIRQSSGRTPHVPSWAIDAQAGIEHLANLIDTLKDRSPTFRTEWDMFRLVFGHPLPAEGIAIDQADGFQRDGRPYVRTLRGEQVDSHEACLIANWLFYNGVDYRYRIPYGSTSAPSSHPYCPDFYYPQADLWHDHLLPGASDASLHFSGEQQSRDWKHLIHRTQGTRYVETASQELRDHQAFSQLAHVLSDAGIALDPHPDRDIPSEGQVPLTDAALIALMRSFISHAKSNALDDDALNQRLTALPPNDFHERDRRFLALAKTVMHAWNDALDAENGIDFEDMLNQAAHLLESGQADTPWTLVMADEFQDASRARARLCRALVNQPSRYFFAVGDDWQSINRFAGADATVMTTFTHYFGPGTVLRLEKTFRCPQTLCDASSHFIGKNPAQLPKHVHSDTPAYGPVLQAIQVSRREQITDAIRQVLLQLAQECKSGRQPPGRSGKLQLLILGRYNADRSCIPADWPSLCGEWLELRFLTIHRSKGTEADIVILPQLLAGNFPSHRADDPVLRLAMPNGDTFPLSEERRLFYVALTRARLRVVLLTVQGRNSPFLDELIADGAVALTHLDGKHVEEHRCPACGTGVILQRTGRYGTFHSCSAYPRCQYKPAR